MMYWIKKPLLFGLYLTFLIITFTLGYIHDHELVHEEISRQHGCQDHEIEIRWDLSASHYCTDPDHERQLPEIMMHNLNDIIAYHLWWLMVLLIIVLGIMVWRCEYE